MPDPTPQTWQSFFDAQADRYHENDFTRNTEVEVQFILNVFGLKPGARILDVGCGTGRHAIALAARGFAVTGLDFSPEMLRVAAAQAAKAGVTVEWIEADATAFETDGKFDAAICICEGGFGLSGHDEEPVQHDLAILRNISASLNPGAPFLLTALNAFAAIRRFRDEDVAAGAFNPATMLAQYMDEWKTPTGSQVMYIRERQYIPSELSAMLYHAGLQTEQVWGGTAGDWGERPLKLDEIEAMYLARKR